MPISLISWAHHSIKKKLQNLPSWSKTNGTGNSLRKAEKKNKGKINEPTIEAKNEAKNEDIKEENIEVSSKQPSGPQASLGNGEVIEMVMKKGQFAIESYYLSIETVKYPTVSNFGT